MAFFTDTNGGNDLTTANPARLNYAPLQQLATDLTGNTVAKYNWITPNRHNDMHTSLTGGYTPPGGSLLTGDSANIRQGDDFPKQIIPLIMGSAAYQNNGAIIIWNDETEKQTSTDANQDDLTHTNMEIVISPLAHPNVGGLPYASDGIAYTHSSDLRTMQELFQVPSYTTGSGYLGDAANATDLSDLFQAGAIPSSVPEPTSAMTILAVAGVALTLRRSRD
jgi:hypothetical protein